MNNTNINRLARTLVAISLSLSIAFTGSMFAAPHTAQAAAVSGKSTADKIIATGKQYLGVRYKYGAKSGSTSSFDCSSFTQNVFRKNGINIPRSSKQQSTVGKYVPRNQLKPGDLVFFYSPIHHVGIYMGSGKVLHTYGKPGVTISDMNSGWWSKNYQTARRVIS